MYVLQRLFQRLVLLVFMLIAIPTVSALFRSGGHHSFASSSDGQERFSSRSTHQPVYQDVTLEASLYDPKMSQALEVLRERKGGLGYGSGAQLSFPSPTGEVTLSASEIGELNQEYHFIQTGEGHRLHQTGYSAGDDPQFR